MKTDKPQYRWTVYSITDENGRRAISLTRTPPLEENLRHSGQRQSKGENGEANGKRLKPSPALRFDRPILANGHGHAAALSRPVNGVSAAPSLRPSVRVVLEYTEGKLSALDLFIRIYRPIKRQAPVAPTLQLFNSR